MKIKRAGLFVIAVAGMLWLNVTAVKAQQSFQIAPPPIPYPYFEPGRKDTKLTGTYMSLKGDSFKFTLGGVDGSFRTAFNEKVAMDVQIAVFGGAGEMDFGAYSINPAFMSIILGGNMEFQFFNNPGGSMIGYIGLNMPMSMIVFNKSVSFYHPIYKRWYSALPSRITTVMYGVPIGIQGGINLGKNWKLTPFFGIIQYLGGTTMMSYTYRPMPGTKTAYSIDSFMTTSFGTDVIYVPWDLSLGTLLQSAASSGDSEEVKTVMIQLSWHWRS